MSKEIEPYIPSDEALKFVAFLRATGNEEFSSPIVHYKMADILFSSNKTDRNVLIECSRGIGKLQSPDSKILTPSGWTTMGDIQPGESVINRYGKSTKVLAKTDLQNPEMYEMEFSDGSSIKVADEHLNIVWDYGMEKREKVLTTKQLLEKELVSDLSSNRKNAKDANKRYRYRVPLMEPAELSRKELALDPYVMGLMLADGYFKGAVISCHLDDMLTTASLVASKGYTVHCVRETSPNGGQIQLSKPQFKMYKELISQKKHIPEEYIQGSIEQRLELLQGLMDGDGSISGNGSCKFHSVSKRLAEDVRDVARSLGGLAHINECHRDDKATYDTEYVVVISMKLNPFKLGRKADKWKPGNKKSKAIVAIRPIEKTGGYCIRVESDDHSYVTDDYTVTHNSTVAEYAVIYAAAMGEWPGFGKCPFIVFLGASAEGNVKQFFKNVASKISNSELLSSVVDVKRQTDKELELVNKDGVEMFITGKGMNVNWRGARSPNGDRPSLLLADDVLHNDSATSETIRNTIDTNWFASALPALAPKHKIVYIGTPIAENDLLHKLKNSGVYSVVKFPLCTKFPVAEAEYDSVWPDRFTYEYTENMYKQFDSSGKTQLFYQEYLLEVVDLGTLLVDDADIKWFEPSLIKKNADDYNFYITTDFATSTKKSADFSTIGVWAINNNSDWMLVDGQCKRQTMQENIDDLFNYVSKWKPLSVGIESSGQQGGFISILEEMMFTRNTWFSFAKKPGSKDPGIRPVKDKVHRFVTGVQPKFKQNKIWLPRLEDVEKTNPRLYGLVDELVHELGRFTLAGGVESLKHDDALDLLNQLSEMELFLPSNVSSNKEDAWTNDEGDLWWTPDDMDNDEEYGGSTVF